MKSKLLTAIFAVVLIIVILLSAFWYLQAKAPRPTPSVTPIPTATPTAKVTSDITVTPIKNFNDKVFFKEIIC